MNPSPDLASLVSSAKLWSLQSVPLANILARMEERGDEECVAAFIQLSANVQPPEFVKVVEMVEGFQTTRRIMSVVEPDTRRRLRNVPGVNERSVCIALEIHALMVEGFVRMERRGLAYPEFNPCDLALPED